MAVGVEIATAYVSIVPSFRGIKANLTKGFKQALGATADSMEAPLVKGAKNAAKKASEAASKEFEFGMRSGTAKVVGGIESALKRVTGITRKEKFFDPAIAQRDLNVMQTGLNNFGRTVSSGFQSVGTSISNAFKSFATSTAQTDTWGQRIFAAVGKADDAVVKFATNVGTKINTTIGSGLSSASKKILTLGGVGEETASKLSGMAKGIGTGLLTVGASASVATVAAIGLGVAVTGVGLAIAGINRLSTIQQSTVAFEVMLGSAEKAKEVMGELTKFAKTTPFPLDAITEAAKTLKAMGQDTDKLVPTLKAAGDAAAALGSGTQGMKDISFIMGQIITKGKLEGDELVQLAERGVNASAILGNKLGVKATEAGAKIKDMGISAKEAVKMIVEGIEEGTDGVNGSTAKMGGMLEKFKQTWEGRWTDMKAAFSRLGATIFEPLFEGGQVVMAKTTKLLDEIGAKWKSFMQEFKDSGAADAVKELARAIVKVGEALVPAGGGFQTLADQILPAFRMSLNLVADLLKKFANWLSENKWIAELLGYALVGLTIFLTLLAGALILAIIFLGLLSVALWVVVGAITYGLYQTIKMLVDSTPGFLSAVLDQIITFVTDMGTIFLDFIYFVVDIFILLFDLVVAIFESLFEVLKAVVLTFYYFLTGQWDKIGEVWSNLGNRMKEIWGGVWDDIISVGADAVNVLVDMINAVSHQINGLINLINSIPGVDVGHIPDIPKLASGGIATGATTAIIGEGSEPEAIMPLSKLENFVNTNPVKNEQTQVVINAAGADRQFLTFLRALVRQQGGGSVQKAFGV